MKIVGITGPTGAGKSALSEYLRGRGIPVIDADALYHSLLIPPSPCLDALRNAFGEEIFSPEGMLDRKKLANIVFGDKNKLELLNKTVLDFVLNRARQILREYEAEGIAIAAIDAPTLIESGFHTECHTVVSVICPSKLRIERIILRDNIEKEAAEARVHGQKSDGFYISHSDRIIQNDSSESDFLEECRSFADSLLTGDIL